MKADPDLVTWAQAWAARTPVLHPRPMFGCPAWFLENKLRLCVVGDGVAVKGTPDAVAVARTRCPWARPFLAHGRTMGPGWVAFVLPDQGDDRLKGLTAWADFLILGAAPPA